MNTRVRERILDFLGQRPMASAGEIARGLGMAAAAVRHHLTILRKDGRIDQAPGRRAKSRGRPELRYRLSGSLMGSNVAMLFESLAKTWGARTTPQAGRQQVSEALARGLVEQLGLLKAGQAASRIAQLVERLNTLHYHSRWEAGAEGPRLIFGHCPYAEVIERHPELCQMDARALTVATGSIARQVAKIDLRAGTVTQCVFTLR